ncbi:MAG: hypothetical protein LAO78_21340 [Acidobacteriia bacterium]|nr:hypothetical protein [Terriglobia bacterium]
MPKILFAVLTLCVVMSLRVIAAAADSAGNQLQKLTVHCPDNSPICADIAHHLQELDGKYSGHDEPAIAFYSNRPGSGNSFTTVLTMPTDPPTPPQQDGSGGTFNFQLHSVFWFSMVLCDTQSAPNFTDVCVPNTDANIFENPDPNATDFIGHHPGSAFLELQFYPPGGFFPQCDLKQWCVAMNILSFNARARDPFTQRNNRDCIVKVGLEPDNIAYLTTSGISQILATPFNADPNPLFNTVPGEIFKMNQGDRVQVSIYDTPEGVKTEVQDLTTGITGSMTASIANGFVQVNFVPDPDPAHPSVTCTGTPYAFHPQYSTSSEHTRAVWTAHTINVAFSDEIGHYELCSAVDHEGGRCIGKTPTDPADSDLDDSSCFSGAFFAKFGLLPVGACIAQELDFDGTSYGFNWPGTGHHATDTLIHPSPIRFTAPQFRLQRHRDGDKDGDDRTSLHDFSRVAFETDTPINEFFTNPNCNAFTGTGCTNPPAGTQFYPIYSTTRRHGGDRDDEGVCSWQLGGPDIPGTENNFGGTATSEYGGELFVLYPGAADATHPNGTTITEVNDFRRVLPNNPCRHNKEDD